MERPINPLIALPGRRSNKLIAFVINDINIIWTTPITHGLPITTTVHKLTIPTQIAFNKPVLMDLSFRHFDKWPLKPLIERSPNESSNQPAKKIMDNINV